MKWLYLEANQIITGKGQFYCLQYRNNAIAEFFCHKRDSNLSRLKYQFAFKSDY